VCDVATLIVALKLAVLLVHPMNTGPSYVVNAVCGCGCLYVESERLSCLAGEARAEEERAKDHNQRLEEFNKVIKQCDLK